MVTGGFVAELMLLLWLLVLNWLFVFYDVSLWFDLSVCICHALVAFGYWFWYVVVACGWVCNDL